MPCRAALLQAAVLSAILLVSWNLVCPQRTISNFSKDVCFAKQLAPGQQGVKVPQGSSRAKLLGFRIRPKILLGY